MDPSLSLFLLSLIVFLPAATGVALLFFPGSKHELLRIVSLMATVAVFVLTLVAGYFFETTGVTAERMQSVFSVGWIRSFEIYYYMGLDGISFPLLILTSFISMLAMLASWSIKKHVKAYCILFLVLVTGMLGVFVSLDFFLFYVFWEVMLLPMYFLIGVWGGPRKEYAAIKFFLYTLVGSVLMLVAILILYFNSDVTELEPEQLARAHMLDEFLPERWHAGLEADLPEAKEKLVKEIEDGKRSTHTFNMLALAEIGQHTKQFSESIQIACFVLLFIGFIIKVPSVPFHTWLPDAHVEAPTPISMILAGVLLKMGGYGIIRICYPICPYAGFTLAWLVCLIGLVSMVYGAFAAMAQRDFKRLVAYSSVSHMGYVVLGFGVWSMFNADYWNMGIQGAMFQMIGHGVSSAGMFFMVGVLYDRVHHRNLNEFGGLHGKMPVYTALSVIVFFAALGLPGLCGFIGEVFVVFSVWNYFWLYAVISASVVVLTAAYILWTIQRVYLGAVYKGPHEEELKPITARELCVAVPLCVFAILLGVFPWRVPLLNNAPSVLGYMEATIQRQTDDLQTWAENHEQSEEEKPAPAKAARRPGKGDDDLTRANIKTGQEAKTGVTNTGAENAIAGRRRSKRDLASLPDP